AAQALVRMSVTVGLGSPSLACSVRRACRCCVCVMSADIAIWNAGACHASVRRREIVRRTEVSGMRSISPGAAGAGAAGAGALALLFTRRAGRAFLLRRFGSRLSRRARDGGYIFPLLSDNGDRRADVGLAFCDRDLEQDAGGLGLDLLGDLVRVELVERLALL